MSSETNILIIATHYPSYGGAATNAYNLIKYYRKKNHIKVCCILLAFAFPNKYCIDPDNIGGIYAAPFFTRCKNHKNYEICLEKIQNNVKNYFDGRFPDIILCKHYIATLEAFIIFPRCKIYYLASGTAIIESLLNNDKNNDNNVSAIDIINDKLLHIPVIQKEVECIQLCSGVICSSDLCYDLMTKLYPLYKQKFFGFVDTSCVSLRLCEQNLSEKIYDICFICSHMERKIKNAAFAYNILALYEFESLKKVVIGEEGRKRRIASKNILYTGKIDNNQVFSMMKQCKLLILPSFYDASPNVVREAQSAGCIPIISKNVGYWKYLDARCVCNDIMDIQEWKQKILNMLHLFANSNKGQVNNDINFEYIDIDEEMKKLSDMIHLS